MGADVYLATVYDRLEEEWRPVFTEAIKRRNSCEPGTAKAMAAQAEVDVAYSHMHSAGYFRDNYNGYGLFAQLYYRGRPLSWWGDVTPLLREGKLHAPEARRLLDMVETAMLDTSEAEAVAREQNDSMPDKGWTADYEARRKRLVDLLKQSIEMDEPLAMSL